MDTWWNFGHELKKKRNVSFCFALQLRVTVSVFSQQNFFTSTDFSSCCPSGVAVSDAA
jgi:hypothetical protein